MSMTYQEFKDYLIRSFWKVGDQQLLTDLDNLILQAHAALRRDLHVEARHGSAGIYVDNTRQPLPADYHSMRSVATTENTVGFTEFKYVEPAQMRSLRVAYQDNSWLPFYSIENKFLMFSGPTQPSNVTTGPTPPASPGEGDLWFRNDAYPGLYVWNVDPNSAQWVQLTGEDAVRDDGQYSNINVIVDYYRDIPDFKTIDQSWVADEYLDIYMLAVTKEASPYLREDERLPNWVSLYGEKIDSAQWDSEFYKTRGVYASKPLPRQAGVSNRRRRH